jgi:2,4-dichlorophenol 6-monooxygenase
MWAVPYIIWAGFSGKLLLAGMGLMTEECLVTVQGLAASLALQNGRTIGKTRYISGILGMALISNARRDSPILSSNIPLLRLEPILRKVAEDRNPGRVLFSHSVTDFTEGDDGVIVTVEQPDGNSIQYRAQYVVCADGGKLSTRKLGINMEGPTGLVDFVSTHFKANLSAYWDGKLELCLP